MILNPFESVDTFFFNVLSDILQNKSYLDCFCACLLYSDLFMINDSIIVTTILYLKNFVYTIKMQNAK